MLQPNSCQGKSRENAPMVALGGRDVVADFFVQEEASLGAWVPVRPLVYDSSQWDKRFFTNTGFAQQNTVESEEDQAKKIIFQCETFLAVPYKEKLARHLFLLFETAKEEDPDGPGISIGSLRSFFDLMQMHSELRYPVISLTPEYNIYASWKKGKSKVFSVHFLPNGNVRFVVFNQNKIHPDKISRLSGITTVDTLMKEAEPHGIAEWVCYEGR